MPLFNRRELDTAPFARQQVTADYVGRLAFIGRRLDDENGRSAVILEISGNFIIRAIDRASGEPILTELVLEDFAEGDVRLPVPPQPTSYEAVLTAIGKLLDERIAANVAVVEGRAAYHVTGWERGHAAGLLTYVPFEQTIDRFELQRLTSRGR